MLTAIYQKLIKPWGRLLAGVLLIAFLALAFSAGGRCAQKTADEQLQTLLLENQNLHTEIAEATNWISTTAAAVKSLSDDNTQLIELVAKLQTGKQVPVVKEVVVVKTVIAPAEPPVKLQELPDQYKFKLAQGLEVARYDNSEDEHVFTTHTLFVKTSIVIGDRKSAALLQIASSAEPDTYYEIPINDLDVRHTDEKTKLFKPDIHLAVRAGLSDQPQLTVSLGLTLLHPTPCIDTVGLNISGNSTTAHLGVIPFGYNIGCHLPVIDDLWIITDGYVGFSPSPSQPLGINYGGGIGIGTKF